MSDVGSFIIGTVATAAGVVLAGATFGLATPLSGALIRFGVGQMAHGLFGGARPSHQGIQANVGSPDATVPVVYGRAKIGRRLRGSW